jgi:hypothetical protein
MATAKQRQYAAAMNRVIKRFETMEEATVKQMVAFLEQYRRDVIGYLSSVPDDSYFASFALGEIKANIENQTETLRRQLVTMQNGALQTAVTDGVEMVVEPLIAASIEGAFFRSSVAQINVLMDYSADLIKGLTGDVIKLISSEIGRVGLGALTPYQAMQKVTDILGVQGGRKIVGGIASRAETIVRTETNRAFSVATQSQMETSLQEFPELQKAWMSTGDFRTRNAHLSAHGQIVGVNDKFTVGGEELAFPRDPAGSAKNTINCILPDNEVFAPKLMAASRSHYSGPVFELTISNGHKLTITPNHPVLTPRGFIAAGLLNVGDYVISSRFGQEIASAIDPYNYHIPTKIEEVWRSLFVSAKSRSLSRSAMPHDFHGDGLSLDGNVDIVWPDSLLWHDPQYPPVSKKLNENFFRFGLVLKRFLPFDGPTDQLSLATLRAANFIVRRLSKFLTIFGREPLHSLPVGIASVSDGHATFNETRSERGARNSNLFGKSKFGLASDISFNNKVKIWDKYFIALGNISHYFFGRFRRIVPSDLLGFLVTPDWYPPLNHSPSDGDWGNSENIRNIFDRFAGLIEPRQVVSIRKFEFTGHVYDLQTFDELYISSTVFVHNCRCRHYTVHPEIGTIPTPLDDQIEAEKERRDSQVKKEKEPAQ